MTTAPGIRIQQGSPGAPPHQQLPDVMYVVGTAPNPTDSGYAAGSVIVSHSSDTDALFGTVGTCLLYTSPSPRDRQKSRMPSSA